MGIRMFFTWLGSVFSGKSIFLNIRTVNWQHMKSGQKCEMNSPLYIATSDLDRELELQYRVHAALDVVEEKCLPSTKATPESRDLYLGLLYATETHKIYGYVTNTKIKFIIVVDSSNIALRENEVRTMFRNLHILYTDAVCNPFYIPGEHLISPKFDKSVRSIMCGNS